jgi:hypothetical protein
MNGKEINSAAMQHAPATGLAADHDNWVALNKWLAQIGASSVTAWRWRKRGWLRVVNVGGRLFLRPEDRAEFDRRAVAGEFSKPPSGAAATASRVKSEKVK